MSGVAVITGGSRGIGAAICVALARDGYDVVVNYNSNKEAADKVVAQVEEQGRRAVAVQADVGKEEDCVRLFTEADKLGPCKALVNNAGVIGKKGPVVELTAAEIQQSLNTNVIGPMICSREAIKRMTDGGSIVNISSGAAYIGVPHTHVLYGVTKGALNSFTIGLSQEVAEKKIRVNTVSPGITETDMVAPDKIENAIKSVPMRRAGQPNEIAEAVAWLVSDRASYTAGANIRVGGGRQ